MGVRFGLPGRCSGSGTEPSAGDRSRDQAVCASQTKSMCAVPFCVELGAALSIVYTNWKTRLSLVDPLGDQDVSSPEL
jgi:hypothetical protein